MSVRSGKIEIRKGLRRKSVEEMDRRFERTHPQKPRVRHPQEEEKKELREKRRRHK
jgi:hypothetical protein